MVHKIEWLYEILKCVNSLYSASSFINIAQRNKKQTNFFYDEINDILIQSYRSLDHTTILGTPDHCCFILFC